MRDPTIRLRACLATVKDDRILLIPNFDTDAGPLQWSLPGGQVEFGESVREAALREFEEETGLTAKIIDILDISEVILPERLWHSVTITFRGEVVSGTLRSEQHPIYGTKEPKWMSLDDLRDLPYHPPHVVRKALEY